jgi:flagellar motor switch protein FliN/FliY
MSELSTTGLAAFKEIIEPLGEAFAASLSEQINQTAVFDAPLVTQESISALITDPEALVQTTFTFPTLSDDEATVLIAEKDALILADLIGMGDGADPPQLLEAEHMERLTSALSGFVEGIGTAIGNVLDTPVAPGPECSTRLVPLTLSAGFLTAGYAVQIAYPFRVEGVLEGELRILITPNLACAIARIPNEEGGEDGMPLLEDDSLLMASNAAGPQAAGLGFGQAQPSNLFQPFQSNGGPLEPMHRGMELIMDIPLDVSVELGRVQMLIKDVLELATGSIVELERVAGEPIDLMVNGQLIAKGEVVVIEDNFGIRITEIVSPADRLTSAGKRAA